MAELKAKSPCAGLLPLRESGVELHELVLDHLTALAPFNGQETALSQALEQAHGLSWPEAGSSAQAGAARILWSGRGQAMLMGVAPDAALAAHAAVTEQSDAWAAVRLSGPAAETVLARLVPLDLRLAAVPVGTSLRTMLQHMNVLITRDDDDAFLILAFRSMAQTLAHDLRSAMEAVAARG